ncbi:MAG: GNAT family N-acetyltransferase [Canibacter sp.]
MTEASTATQILPEFQARRPVPALGDEYEFAYVKYTDPLGEPLLKDLEREYDERYGVAVLGEPAIVELNRYAPELFAAPLGAFLLLLHQSVPVSGGAFMPKNGDTAEVKRVWTASDHRNRGLARLVLTELEHRGAELGYRQFFLTTGPRQPEARALYLKHGYTPHFDTSLSGEQIGHPLPFLKSLPVLPDSQQNSSRFD